MPLLNKSTSEGAAILGAGARPLLRGKPCWCTEYTSLQMPDPYFVAPRKVCLHQLNSAKVEVMGQGEGREEAFWSGEG